MPTRPSSPRLHSNDHDRIWPAARPSECQWCSNRPHWRRHGSAMVTTLDLGMSRHSECQSAPPCLCVFRGRLPYQSSTRKRHGKSRPGWTASRKLFFLTACVRGHPSRGGLRAWLAWLACAYSLACGRFLLRTRLPLNGLCSDATADMVGGGARRARVRRPLAKPRRPRTQTTEATEATQTTHAGTHACHRSHARGRKGHRRCYPHINKPLFT